MMKKVKKILIIVAHPDDAELMFGGLIKHYSDLSVCIDIIITTDGSAWGPNAIKNNIIKVRQEEQKQAAKILGVHKVYFLNQKDGFINKTTIKSLLLENIRNLNPNMILTHSENENHPDHIAVASVVKELVNGIDQPPMVINPFIKTQSNPLSEFYGAYTFVKISEISDKNVLFFELSKKEIEYKQKAIQQYVSQFDVNKMAEKALVEASFLGDLAGISYAECIKSINAPKYVSIKEL